MGMRLRTQDLGMPQHQQRNEVISEREKKNYVRGKGKISQERHICVRDCGIYNLTTFRKGRRFK